MPDDLDQLRGLLRANRSIVGKLALPEVLRHIVSAACQLVDARYGALGVLASDGGLGDFITVGIDDQTAARMGHPPAGLGVLGALIEDPHPIRLTEVTDDPRSVGLPTGHPPMHAFLGVPVRVRDTVFGNLYLARDDDRPFTADDEQLVSSLAATAGITIENTRLFAEARRRQDWLEAATEITRQLLAMDGTDPLQVVAERVQHIAAADSVNVVLPTPDGAELMIEVATGLGAERLLARSVPRDGTACDIVIETGAPELITDARQVPSMAVNAPDVAQAGPAMVLPLGSPPRVRGALVIARQPGRPPFTEADLAMAATFAVHAALALELADARLDQQRVVLLEDRDRIARDLHDHVIQRLFAAGLTIESVAAAMGQDPRADRLARVVGELDATIRGIRDTIYQLRGPLIRKASDLRAQVFTLATELAPLLGFDPLVTTSGPIDSVVDPGTADDVLAVVREALTNIARHAQARTAEVTISASPDRISVVVSDDGVGLGGTTRRSGLANLNLRAQRHGGTFDIGRPDQSTPNGTELRWTIPLT